MDARLGQLFPAHDVSTHEAARRLSAEFCLSVSITQVKLRAARLGLKKPRHLCPNLPWPEAAVADMLAMVDHGLDDATIAARLEAKHGRAFSANAVRHHRTRAGVRRLSRSIWSEKAVEIMHGHYGKMRADALAKLIHAKTGQRFTPRAVEAKAIALGIQARDASGGICIADAAREAGISHACLSRYIRQHGIKVEGTGRFRFITLEDMERVKAAYPRITEPVVTPEQAGRMLCLTPGTVRKNARTGLLRAYHWGTRVLIPVSALEERRKELGITRPLPATFGVGVAS